MEDMTPEEMDAMMEPWNEYNRQLLEAGAFVAGEGLHPSSSATTIRLERRQRPDRDRRPLRRDQGAARRLLPDRVRGPRRGARVGQEAAGPPGQRRRGPPGDGLQPSSATPTRTRKPRRRRRSGRAGSRPAVPARVGRAVATLIRLLGDFDLAEEVVQEAFVVAMERWPETGVPDQPAGWILTTARNRAIDRLRRDRRLAEKHRLLAADLQEAEEPAEMDDFPDDRLRLIFTCCHPSLAPEAQGRPHAAQPGRPDHAGDRARVPRPRADDGPAHRAGEAKDPRRRHSLRGAARRTSSPSGSPSVLAVLYLVFNEGYAASSGDALVRRDLCAEAIRLGGLLAALMPDEAEVLGLARADAAPGLAARRARGRRRRHGPAGGRRIAGCGTARRSRRASPSAERALALAPARALRAAGRDRREHAARPERRRTPTGRGSPRSTAS